MKNASSSHEKEIHGKQFHVYGRLWLACIFHVENKKRALKRLYTVFSNDGGNFAKSFLLKRPW